jgi:hypothetical protein
MGDEMESVLVEAWKWIIVGEGKSWVLFANGTCVILMEPAADLGQQATALLKEWGPVHPGSPAADFSVIELANYPGWVVMGHHRDILTYVAPDEFNEPEPAEVMVGLIGRSKRDQDAAELKILYIEDKRNTQVKP